MCLARVDCEPFMFSLKRLPCQGERGSVPRHKVRSVYQDVKKLAVETATASAAGHNGAPVIGENVLVGVEREQGKDLIGAKIIDVEVAEGKRTLYSVQMPDGSELSLVRTDIFTLKEASVPHSFATGSELLPGTRQLKPLSPKAMHSMGIAREDFAKYSEFLVRHSFRKSLFSRDWAPYTVRTDVIPLTCEDVEAFVTDNWDHLQESVAPQMASFVSLFALANHGGGSEVSGGSGKTGKSGASGTHREGSEHDSFVSGSNVASHVSNSTLQTKQSSFQRSKSQTSADDDRSEGGRSGSQYSGSAVGSRASKEKKHGARASRFRRQHGLLVDIETSNALDHPLVFQLSMLADDVVEAEAKTEIVRNRLQNPGDDVHLNRREAEAVGVLLGTKATANLLTEMEQLEEGARTKLTDAKRMAGRKHIKEAGLNFDRESEMEEIESRWQQSKEEIEEEIKKINQEIAKIDENIYEETSKECAEKISLQKGKKRHAEIRLEHERQAMKASKKQVNDRDDELEASVHVVVKEAEGIERILFMLETYVRELKEDEIERRHREIREFEMDQAQQHRKALIWSEPLDPTDEEYFEMASRVQRGIRCYRARKTFAGIISFWGKTAGSISFQGCIPPLSKNFVLSDGPEIWNYYRDYGLSVVGPDGHEYTQCITRYTAARQVQIGTPFAFPITEGTLYRVRFPEDPETILAAYRDLFHREDIHQAGLIGRSQLNRALMSVGVKWDQEDLDELITIYGKTAPEKLTVSEYLLALRHDKLEPAINVDLLRSKKISLLDRAPSQASGSVDTRGKGQENSRLGKGQRLRRGDSVKSMVKRTTSNSGSHVGPSTGKIIQPV